MEQVKERRNGIMAYVRENRKVRRMLIAGAIVVFVAIVALWWYYSGRESTDDAQIDGHIIPISAKVGGTLEAIYVEENTFVKQGTLLVKIDPTDYRVALDRAKANLAQAQADAAAARNEALVSSTSTSSGVATATAGVGATQAQVQAAAAEVQAARARANSAEARAKAAQANWEKASRDVERLRPLLAKDEISQRDFDAASTAATAAQADYESAQAAAVEAAQQIPTAEAKLAAAREQLKQSEAGLRVANTAPQQQAAKQAQAASADAKVAQMKAALDQAQLNVEYTTIKAPVSGWVSKRAAEPGQIIQPGQPLFSIVPTEDIWETANFKETQLKNMRVNQPATISVDAYGRDYHGHVESFSPATGARFSLLPPENATGNYVKVVQRIPVRIAIDRGQDAEHLLRPGMSVTATVKTRG